MRFVIFFITVGLLGCAHTPKEEATPLGAWKRIDYFCENGELTQLGLEEQKKYRSNDFEEIRTITPDSSLTVIKSYEGDKADYCELTVKEKSEFMSDGSTYKVSDTVVTSKAFGKSKCKGTNSRPEMRTHEYELSNNTLKVILKGKGWSWKSGKTSGAENYCTGGDEALLYQRI